MILSILLVVALAALSGLLYYMGGCGKEEGHKKLPFMPLWLFASWIRDWVIPAVACLALWILYGLDWSMLIVYPLMGGALSTYHKWLNKIFKKPKTDAFWFNWLAHGLVIGLSLIPYVYFYQHNYFGFALLVLALGYLTMLWSEKQDKVEIEAFGRGTLIILSLLLLGADIILALVLVGIIIVTKKRKSILAWFKKVNK